MENYYSNLWKKLDNDIPSNIQFAQLVYQQEPLNTRYFFGDYSYPILKWIAISFFRKDQIENVIYTLYGDYYEFVSYPIDDFNNTQWYQLKTYRGENGMKLKTWLMSNFYQYFTKRKIKIEKQHDKENGLLDFIDYVSLISLDICDNELSDEEHYCRERLKKAWQLLSDKDKRIIDYLVIEKLHWRDAYEELNCYIRPRNGREAMTSWTDKRKQDALAMMKARAIEHLAERFNKTK